MAFQDGTQEKVATVSPQGPVLVTGASGEGPSQTCLRPWLPLVAFVSGNATLKSGRGRGLLLVASCWSGPQASTGLLDHAANTRLPHQGNWGRDSASYLLGRQRQVRVCSLPLGMPHLERNTLHDPNFHPLGGGREARPQERAQSRLQRQQTHLRPSRSHV